MVSRLLISSHPMLLACALGVLLFTACGGEAATEAYPQAGEACRPGGVCDTGLTCVADICVDPNATGDAGEGDVTSTEPDTEDRDAEGPTSDTGDAEPAVPDVEADTATPTDTPSPGDVTPAPDTAADVEVEDDGTQTLDTTPTPDTAAVCSQPADCADAFDTVPACQVSTCDVATGECILASLADDTPCDDDNACSYNDVCSDGQCAGVGGDCDDDNPCTEDECTSDGCEHDPKVGVCDDGNLCTTDDFCIAGTCLGDPTSCGDSPTNECLENGELRAYETTGVCDVNSGFCDYAYQDVACIEGCIDGGCASNKCQVEVAGTPCDDGLECTLSDSCTFEGTCVGIAIDCSELASACLEATCDVADGECKTLPVTDGTLCDDVDECTLSDHCAEGGCVAGSVISCDDSNPCTDDSCDPLTGGCVHLPNSGACDDGDVCTVDDTCAGGFCFGANKDCGDGNQCTEDICNSDGSCSNPLIDDPCDDGNECTAGDVCAGGVCSGEELSCEDGNPCTENGCEPGVGCIVIGDTETEIPCFTGDATLIGVGACAEGARSCTNGVLGPCVGQVLPVEEVCANSADDDCDNDTDEPQCTDPPVGLEGAELEWTISNNSPGVIMGQWADLHDGTYQQTVGGFMNHLPMTAGTVEVSVGPLSATGTFSTEAYAASWIAGTIRNPGVYADDPVVRAVVQVRDPLGRPVVAPGKADLRLMQAGQDDIVVPCYVGPASVCEIAASIPDDWFSPDIPMAVSTRFELSTGEETSLSTVLLQKKPPVEALPDPGVVVTLPHGPQHTGRTFTVPIYAVSASSVIESFDITVPFDPAVLSVNSVTIDPRYDGVHNPKYDEVLMVAVRQVDTALEDATGQVHLADIEFKVRDDAPQGASVQFAPQVTSLYDLQNSALTGPDGSYVVHVQSGQPADSTGVIEVAEDPLRGLYAIADNIELFNTSSIFTDGEDITSQIHVFTIHAYGPDEEVTTQANCASAFDANLKITGNCVATLDETTTSSTSGVNVTATYGEAETTLPFRVWQPVYPVSVKVEDNYLERIAGVLNEDCSAERFQETRVHVDVSFRHSTSGTDVVTGRFDNQIAIDGSGFESVLAVEGNVARGLSSGQATITAQGAFGEIGSTQVIVSDNATTVTGIDVIVPTDIAFDSFTPAPPFLHVGTALGQATLIQAFDFEGKSGPILAYATFEDNRRMAITQESGLSVTSLAPNALSVEDAPLRAVTLDSGSGDMLDARWTVCESEVASGVGHVEMELPAPIGAEITLSADALARSVDDAAALAGLPLCASVHVELIYETGATKDFTLDSRTLYDDIGGDPSDLFELQAAEGPDGAVTGIEVCSIAGANWGAFALLVSFTHAPELETFIVPVNIVQAQGLTLQAEAWPPYAGSEGSAKTTFSQLELTGQYQQGVLESVLELSDGTSVNVSTDPSTTYALNPVEGAFSVTSPNLLAVSGAGSVQITASFGDQESTPVALTASDASVNVSTLALDFPQTFKGVADWKAETLSVTAAFEDGTVLSDAQEVAGLLTYDVSHPDAMTIDSGGVAELLANERVMVSISATATQSNASSSIDTACNLDPSVGDVDLGQLFGIAHPDVLPGEDFTIPVRVNTGSQPLGALDLTFTYDPTVIQAMSGSAGNGWPGGQLEITLNDPPGEVHIVAAASAGTSASGNALEVVRVNFQGLKSEDTNLTLIEGSIRKLLDNTTDLNPIGNALDVGETRAIVAGHGWLDPDCAEGVVPSDILGNSDGDCEFSVADVSFGLQFLAELIDNGAVPSHQVNALDADRNGQVDVADVVYLIRVLAGKFHFASLAVTENGGLLDDTTLEVTLLNAAGAPVNEQALVYLELATTLNTEMTVTTGTEITTTPAGFVVEAAYIGNGTYRVSTTDMAAEENIGVAMIIRTQDGVGETADDRVVALHSSTWLNPGSEFVAFAPVNFGGNAAPLCLPGECTDSNPCTDDACDPAVGCVFTNNTINCNDGDDCTEADKCEAGVCLGVAIPGCGEATFCGNDICEEGETCSNCLWDCGECASVCGDGTCDWDEDCESCSADCGACAGDCCLENDSPGCDDATITACVCAVDPYCCSHQWEANCVIKAALECGNECVTCGDGLCDESENCLFCPDDCGCSCGDGLCTTDEDCGTCPDDCGGPCEPICGDGECNGDEVCDSCIEDCGECDPFCGDLTCDDEVLGTCSDDGAVTCASAADCATAGATCDGYYQKEGCCAECQECPADCGGACEPYCGDSICHVSNDETCLNCELDCGECGGDCCIAHDGVGCDYSDHVTLPEGDATALATCVCAIEPECCTIAWGYQCLMAAMTECNTPCPYCGDDICDASFGEDMETCKVDCCPDGICPEYCGNGICGPKVIGTCADGAETPKPCVDDSECDGVTCEGYFEGETCSTCAEDCGGCSDASCCSDSTLTCDASVETCGGCSEPEVMTCVCESLGLSSCCAQEWNDICVQMAFQHCAPACDISCGDGMCTTGATDIPETLGICNDGAAAPAYCVDDSHCADGFVCEGYLPGQPGEVLENCLNCEADCGVCETECGNSICEDGETCESCQDDCGPCVDCGDGICQWPENCDNCEDDCEECADTCEDGLCQLTEDASSCPSDCIGVICGDGVCVGVLDGNTEPHETNGNCPEDCQATCGDGFCADEEDCVLCPDDCGVCPATICGDGICAGTNLGEGCGECPEDCSVSCLDICTVYGPVCSGACDPLGATTGCGDNLACAPTKTTPGVPPDIPGGTWFLSAVQTVGSGVCGIGFTVNAGFASDGCENHDDCCVHDPGTGEDFCGTSQGFGCLTVQGLATAGICGRACNPGTGDGCEAGELCEVSHNGPGAVGICIPSGQLCDFSNPVASGCAAGAGSFNSCLGLRDEAKTGACFKGCHATDPSACDDVPAGQPGDSVSCLPRNTAEYHEGTCVGGGAESCDITAPDPCAPGGGDRCNIVGGGVLSGLSFYCVESTGTATTGDACGQDADCQPGNLCYSGTCRPACTDTAGCAGAGTCTGVGVSYNADAAAISVCIP